MHEYLVQRRLASVPLLALIEVIVITLGDEVGGGAGVCHGPLFQLLVRVRGLDVHVVVFLFGFGETPGSVFFFRWFAGCG